MAYVDHRSFTDLVEPASRLGDSDSVGLGHDEWSVVEFAKNDGLWSLNPDGLLQRLARTLFGIGPAQPLANERLEALRRLAVMAWRRRIDPARIASARAAGLSCAEVSAVLNHIARQLKLRSMPRGLA